MATSKRRFSKHSFIHVYQRSVDRGILFYSFYDYIVYISILSVVAAKYGVCIIAICPMPDHLHLLIKADSLKDLYSFIRDYTHLFALKYNIDCGRKGALIDGPFGSAPKYDDKNIRTSVSYVFNNPVEKQLCTNALRWRWNLLAYGASSHPFSDAIKKEKASKHLRSALNTISSHKNNGLYLNYPLLRRLFSPLSDHEKEQLIDHILNLYSPIDYDVLTEYYKDYKSMIIAIESNTGKEFDIKEEYDPTSDAVIPEMAKYLSLKYSNAKKIRQLPDEEKYSLWKELSSSFAASPKQLSKILHLPLTRK